MRTCVIMNPDAGSVEDLPETMQRIRREESLGEVDIRLTDAEEGGGVRAREARREGFDLILAAGGDGTVNAVVNGIGAGADGPAFGILPLGTGNDLARSLGMPEGLEKALAALGRGAERSIDLIRVTGGSGERLCVNASAGGFSGQVDEGLTPEMKKSWGPLAYVRSAMESLPEVPHFLARVRDDRGEWEEVDTFNIVVANGRYVAGGIQVAPRARLDDGLLDLVLIMSAPLGELAALAPRVALGKHVEHELVVYRSVRSVTVESDPHMWFNVDGELIDQESVRFEVLPGTLRVRVGEEEGAAFDGPSAV